MNTDNSNTNRTARKFRSMFAAAVALMLVAAACSQTVEETAQTAAATTTTPTAAGTTTPDMTTATTAAVARDDGGGAEGADTTDASDEQVTTGTEEPGAPDTTIGDSDTTVDVGGEADDTPADIDDETDDGAADIDDVTADTEETDDETGDGEEAGDSEPDDGGGSDGATPGDEDDGEESDTEIGNEDEGDSDNEETDGEPDSGEGEDNNSDDTDGRDDNESGEEEETSGNTYPSTAEEARAAGLMVVDSALVLSSLRLPSDAENYYPATDAFLDGSGAEWGLWLPKKKELWVPPSTGNTHHIDLEFLDIEDEFFGCVSSMRSPVVTLRAGDLVTMRSAPHGRGVVCYGSPAAGPHRREIHEPHGHRVVAVVPWSVFGRDYQSVIMCTAGGEWAGGAGSVLVRIDEDRTVWKEAIARLPSVQPCNHNAP